MTLAYHPMSRDQIGWLYTFIGANREARRKSAAIARSSDAPELTHAQSRRKAAHKQARREMGKASRAYNRRYH